MGKKSKKNPGGAKAKAKAGASSTVRDSDDAGATTDCKGGGGGNLTSGGGSSRKKQRCVLCCALLKDLSKAHACPGCSLLYCWRCERKAFSACPNADNCARYLERCKYCRVGETMVRELVAAGVSALDIYSNYIWDPNHRTIYQDIVQQRMDLTDDSWPYAMCGGNGCFSSASNEDLHEMIECFHCASASANKLLSCFRCKKFRCRACASLSNEICNEAYDVLMSKSDQGGLSQSAIAAFGDCFFGHMDMLALCQGCSQYICFDCVDSSEIERSAKEIWAFNLEESVFFRCRTCYWSAKTCTNPNCPNEVGVPTKRCGGCCIDRYCSIECQALMYPDHVERCQNIKEKRLAAGKVLRVEE